MTHEELQDRLLDLACGELSPGDAREVEAHVAACEGCRAELARMQATRRIMSSLPQVPAPDDGRAVLVAAAREAARFRAPVRRWSVLLRDVALAASLLAVGMVAWRLLAVGPGAPVEEDRGALEGRGGYAEPPPPLAAAPQPAPPPAVAQAPARGEAKSAAEADRAPAARNAPPEERLAAAPPPRPERAPKKKAESQDAARRAAPAGPAQDLAVADAAPPPAPATAAPAPTPVPAAPAAPMAGAPALRREEAHTQTREAERQRARALAVPPPGAAGGAGRVAAKALVSAEAPAADAADPVARYEALRSAGKLRADFRMAPGCAVEAWRRVERDPEGRIAAYAWDEVRDGRRVILEVVYAPDGAVAARRARDAETRAAVAVEFAAPAAAQIDLDAPARCR
jgi:anti-sigma factor RsiW